MPVSGAHTRVWRIAAGAAFVLLISCSSSTTNESAGGGTSVGATGGGGGSTAGDAASQGGTAGGSGTGASSAGGTGAGGAAGTTCTAPFGAELALAAKTTLPKTFTWKSFKECQPKANNYSAGSECKTSPCGSCATTWKVPSVASDGLSFDVFFDSTCEVSAWQSWTYCDQSTNKTTCVIGVVGSGTVHVVVDTPTYLPGPKTLDWQITAATVTATWAASAANTCQYFTPAQAGPPVSHDLEGELKLLTLGYQCP